MTMPKRSMHKTPTRLQKTPREMTDLPFDQPQLAFSQEEAYHQLIHIGAYQAPRGQNYPAHYHQALELVLYRTGHAQIVLQTETGLETSEVHSGNLAIIPPGLVHADRAIGAYSNYYLQIEPQRFGVTFDQMRIFRDDGERNLERVLQALNTEWHSRSPQRERMMDLLLDQLEVLLTRLESETEASGAELLVRRMERLLEERFAENPSILDLAQELGASASGIRAQFARLRGYSPKAYLQKVRLERAIAAIRGSSLSLEEIAGLHGYDSASHLSRHIKQVMRVTPGTFRAR